MRNCILCNVPTCGSIGAAGIQWPHICQPCKDKEDKALAVSIAIQVKAFDVIAAAIFPATER